MLNTEPTANQINRTEREYSEIAGEPVKIEFITGNIYAFCGELGALRIEHHMRTGRAGFSKNLNTWYWAKN